MTQKPTIPFLDYQESRTKQGIRATVRLEKVLRVTMPSGYDSRGKYQIVTSYESAKDREVELDEEQARRGRFLMSKLEEDLKKQMTQAGWREAQRTDGKPLVGRNGSVIWEFGLLADFPIPATTDEQRADLQRQLAEQADLIEKLEEEKADLESQLDQQGRKGTKRQPSGGEIRTYKVYGSAEARLKAEKNGDAPLFTRSVRTHTITFTCAICGRERTEEHLPGQKPTVCSEPGVKTACQQAAARSYTARSRERKAKQKQAKL